MANNVLGIENIAKLLKVSKPEYAERKESSIYSKEV